MKHILSGWTKQWRHLLFLDDDGEPAGLELEIFEAIRRN